MITSVHPVILAAAIGCGVALIALVVAWVIRNAAVKTTMFVLAIVSLLPAAYLVVGMNPWLVDARFRTYKAFYRDIREGMTRDEVFAAMDRHYPKNGVRQRPKVMEDNAHGLGFFMNPENSIEPNCEGIFLSLGSGRVTGKVYSPD